MRIRSILLLLLAFVPVLRTYSAPTAEEAQAALDINPSSGFLFTGTNSAKVDSEAITDGSSLALTRTAENANAPISFGVYGWIEGNTLVEFYFKERNIGRYFDFSAKIGSQRVDSIWGPANEAGWRKVSVLATANQNEKLEMVFRLQSDEPNEDAALLLDGFKIAKGNALILEPNIRGNLIANPNKSYYADGESVVVSVQAKPGYRFKQLNIDSFDFNSEAGQARDDYPYDLRDRASINVLMRSHMQLSASYESQIPCEGAVAWSLKSDYEPSDYVTDKPEDFVVQASVEELHQPGVLSFEFSAFKSGTIDLILPTARTGEKLRIPANPSEDSFVLVQIPFDAAPGSVEWIFNTGYEYQDYPAVMKIRNLRYLTTPETIVGTYGLGQVAVEEISDSASGTPRSRFTANPADGWIFIGWKNSMAGPVFSRENGLVLDQDQPRSLFAIFGEIFESETLSLVFVHDGKTTLSPTQAADEYTGVSLKFESGEESSYLTARGISVYARNLPAGAIEWTGPYDSVNVSRPQAQASELYLITQNLESRETDPFVYKFRHVIPDEPSYTLEVTGDSQTFNQSPGPYAPQDIATLSIKEGYLDRFAGWQGDIVSSKPSLQFPVARDLSIAAYFQQAAPFESPIPLQWSSPYFFTFQNAGGHLLSSLSPNFKTTLSGHAEGPCRLKFKVIGNPIIQLRTPTETSTLYLQNGGPDNSAEFKVLIEEAGDFSINFTGQQSGSSLDLQFLGVYQSVTAHEYVKGGSVTLDDSYNSERIVGSTITFNAEPAENYRFAGWLSPDLPQQASATSVELYHDLTFIPKFALDLGTDSVEIAAETLEEWGYDQYYTNFEALQTPPRGEPVAFTVNSTEAGLLRFRVGPSTNAEVLIDDQAFQHWHGFSLEENTFLHEIPVPDGAHKIEIRFSASTSIVHAHYSSDIIFQGLEFLPGFTLLKGFNAPQSYDFTVSPTAPANVYPAGSKVTLTAPVIEYNTFDRWSGDISGSTRSIQVTMDRHLSVAPVYRPTKSIAPSSFSLSNGSNVLAIPHEWEQPLEVRGSSSPTVFTFTVPANQELQFETEGTLETTMTWKVSGEPTLQKYAGSIIAAPPSPQQRTATLSINIPVNSSEFVTLTNFQTRNRFLLAGDFGLNSDDVLVSPGKENYAWGEQVTISLANSAPSNSRFYDLVTFRPSYDKTEWPSSDFVREYKVSINGDTYVTGNIGSTFTRTKGQITTTPQSGIRPSSLTDPTGTSSREIDSSTLCRVHAAGSKYIRFYLKVPEGDTVIFDSLVSGIETPILGAGEWMQVGVPVPNGRDFVSFSIVDGGLAGDPSYFSLIDTLSGYAPAYISFGPGTIQIEPTQGVATVDIDVTLRAVPNDVNDTHLWLTPIESSAPTIVAKPNSVLPVFSYFETPDPIISPERLPWNLQAIGAQPSFSNSDNDRRITLKDESITLTRTVTGPKVLELKSHIDQRVSLVLKIGSSSYTVTHPNYNGYISHYYSIPPGNHVLTLSYDPQTSDSNSILYDLKEIDGYMLNIANSESSVIKYPNKEYYNQGETVTLLANPPLGFSFDSWKGSIQSAANPKQIVMTQHYDLKPAIVETSVVAETGEIWTPIQSLTSRHSYETLLNGPGTLYLNVGVDSLPVLNIDGTRTTPRPYEVDRCYFLIPEGKHRIQLHQNRSLRAAPTSYLHGYKVDLSAEKPANKFQIIPDLLSYQKGDQVTVDWPLQIQPVPSDLHIFLQPTGESITLPHTFTVTDHLVGQLYAAVPSPLENLYTSSLYHLLEDTHQIEFLRGNDIHEGIDLSFNQRALHLQLEERGTLSFTFRGNRDNEYNTYNNAFKLDGKTILKLIDGQSYQINIPTGRHLITWVPLDASLWPAGICYLDALTFTPVRQVDSFRDQLEESISNKTLAISDKLQPTDDIDGDGMSNENELKRGANPGQYDLPIWIFNDRQSPAQTLEIFLTQNPYSKNLDTPPTACIEFTPTSEYFSTDESYIYAVTYLPKDIPFARLALQKGTLDDETKLIYWETIEITPSKQGSASASGGSLVRLKFTSPSSSDPLVRFTLMDEF